MDALAKILAAEGGLALLVLLSPTIALGIVGFLWFKSMQKNAQPIKPISPNPTIQALGQGLVLREEYEAMLSSLRKQLGLLAYELHEVSERLARVETKQDAVYDERRSKDRRK
jgi:hypothetical protein